MFCSWATDYEQRDRWSLSIYYVDVDGKRVHDRPSDLMADVPEPGPQLLSCLTPADPSVRYVRLHFDIQIQLIAWMSDVYDCEVAICYIYMCSGSLHLTFLPLFVCFIEIKQ